MSDVMVATLASIDATWNHHPRSKVESEMTRFRDFDKNKTIALSTSANRGTGPEADTPNNLNGNYCESLASGPKPHKLMDKAAKRERRRTRRPLCSRRASASQQRPSIDQHTTSLRKAQF